MSHDKVVRIDHSTKTVYEIVTDSSDLTRDEREILLCHALGLSKTELLVDPRRIISNDDYKKVLGAFQKRLSGVPLAYIIGERDFYGMTFFVNKNVLIPRPETELMVDLALDLIKNKDDQSFSLIDIGTGSANVLIALAHHTECRHNDFYYCGIDISEKALSVAQKNAQTHNLEEVVDFFKGDLLHEFPGNKSLPLRDNSLIITANLPYVDITQKDHLSKKEYASELKFEPQIALWADDGGLLLYKKLVRQICSLLSSNTPYAIHCFFEIDPSQQSALLRYLKSYAEVRNITFFNDLSGHARICCFDVV